GCPVLRALECDAARRSAGGGRAGASRARPGRPAYHAGRDHGGRAKALRGSDACTRRRREAADGESAGGTTYAARTSAAGHSRRDRLTQWSLTRACDADRVALSFPRRPGGGMADAGDLKSSGREAVWVRPPPRVCNAVTTSYENGGTLC